MTNRFSSREFIVKLSQFKFPQIAHRNVDGWMDGQKKNKDRRKNKKPKERKKSLDKEDEGKSRRN